MSGGRVTLAAAAAAAGLVSVLAVPEGDRALALFAYVLLLGAAALAVLVRLTIRANPVAADTLGRPRPLPPGARRVPQLEEIERELETVLAYGSDPRRELRARIRVVASARLAERRGIELDRQPEQARAAIPDPLTWELVQARERFEPVELPPLRAAELRRILDSLERI